MRVELEIGGPYHFGWLIQKCECGWEQTEHVAEAQTCPNCGRPIDVDNRSLQAGITNLRFSKRKNRFAVVDKSTGQQITLFEADLPEILKFILNVALSESDYVRSCLMAVRLDAFRHDTKGSATNPSEAGRTKSREECLTQLGLSGLKDDEGALQRTLARMERQLRDRIEVARKARRVDDISKIPADLPFDQVVMMLPEGTKFCGVEFRKKESQ